jgi:hypothetical protein
VNGRDRRRRAAKRTERMKEYVQSKQTTSTGTHGANSLDRGIEERRDVVRSVPYQGEAGSSPLQLPSRTSI